MLNVVSQHEIDAMLVATVLRVDEHTQVMAPPPKETGFYATLALRNGGDKIAS